ncbi:MAG TPA: hypothetical protein DEH78_19035 [Solibacterales bacterium]|nr:hypothetical protein [Bryobacterales bacterium]
MTPGFEPGGVFTRPKPAAPSTGRPGLPGAPDVAGQFQAQYGGAMGQVRPGAGGGQEILLGQGWVPLNPSDPGHQFAQMAFNRYGANWAGGSPAGYHSTDTLGAFQAVYGRPPTQQEQMDLYYRGGGQDLMRQAAALPASAWSFMASPNQAFLQQWRARHGGG